MADDSERVMQNIRDYAQKVRSATEQDVPALSDAASNEAYERRLDQTIHELQERVRQQRLALNQIKASSASPAVSRNPSDKQERLRQLRTVKAAYTQLSQSEPSLPGPNSMLPTVLALRTLQRTVSGSIDAIATTRQELGATEDQLRRERAALAETQTMNAALNARVDALRQTAAVRAEQDPHSIAYELVAEQRAKKRDYERETLRLHDALVKFTHDHLGAMVAAEELGGPVVGEDPDVGEADLDEGSGSGRKRKAKELDDDTRQRRIDEIWRTGGASGHGHDHDHDSGPMNDREAAAREVHGLIEHLIQALIGTSGEGVYVRLERDSAAARFLVRAKVAQYHPKDARRLRLVDFGREIDD